MEIKLSARDAILIHTSHHVLLVVVGHVDSSDEKVGVISLQGLLELGVTDVGLEGVVGVGVAVAHEGDSTVLSLGRIECVELLGHLRNVFVGIAEQRHAQEDGLVGLQAGQIVVVEVGAGDIAVIHELLDGSHDSGKLLTGDDLKRLHIDGAVLGSADGVQEVTGLVVVAADDVAVVVGVLTGTGTVDADVAGEGHIDVGIGECSLVGSLGLVESLEGVVPGGTEGYQQDGNVLA